MLADILAQVPRDDRGFPRFIAALVPEPCNQYDQKAVAVYAGQVHMGYRTRDHAAKWHDDIARVHAEAGAAALLGGGGRRRRRRVIRASHRVRGADPEGTRQRPGPLTSRDARRTGGYPAVDGTGC